MTRSVKPCRRCPVAGDCAACGFPGSVRAALACSPRCECGGRMTAELFHPGISEIAGTWFLACSRHGSLWHAFFDRGASRIDHDVAVIAG